MTSKKHSEDEHDEHKEPKAKTKTEAPKVKTTEATSAFPYTASINEPQTVSLPLPSNVEVPVPAITSLAPADCVIGEPDFTLHITGENFFADSVIHFADHDEPTTLNADGTLSTGVKPSLWGAPAVVQVQVKNGPAVSEAVDFEFKAAATRRK